MTEVPDRGVDRILRFKYDHPKRATRASLRRADDDSESGELGELLLERFGSACCLVCSSRIDDVPGHARLVLEVTDGEGQSITPIDLEWALNRPRYEARVEPEWQPEATGALLDEEPALPPGVSQPRSYMLAASSAVLDNHPQPPGPDHAAWFFMQYEVQTHEPFLRNWPAAALKDGLEVGKEEIGFRVWAVHEIFQHLSARVLARQGMGYSAPLKPEHRRLVAFLSDIQRCIIQRFFPEWHEGGTLRGHPLGLAFERFAKGELLTRLTDATGSTVAYHKDLLVAEAAPDGPAIFLFAEFALLAIEQGIDAEFWARLLPTLESMQHLYWHAWGSPPAARQSAAQFTIKRKQQHPSEVTGATLEGIRDRSFSGISEHLDPSEVATIVKARLQETLEAMFDGPYAAAPADD